MRRSMTLVFSCVSITLIAQEGSNGPRVGLDLATQSVGGFFKNTDNLLVGPQIGWFFELPLHPQFSIMPEVQWMTKGTVVRNPTFNQRDRTTQHYLEVPISAKISTDIKPGGLYLLVGPSFGYFLSGKTEQWIQGQKTVDQKYDVQSSDNRFQFSALVGMGSEWGQWAFDVRAQTSLTPFSSTIQAQNVVYALTFAYRIPPKKERIQESEE